MPTIEFQDAKEFAMYVASQPALGDAPKCVFLTEEKISAHRYHSCTDNITINFKYHALVPVVEMRRFLHITLDLAPFIPSEWGHMDTEGVLDYVCGNKGELVKFLKVIKVKDS